MIPPVMATHCLAGHGARAALMVILAFAIVGCTAAPSANPSPTSAETEAATSIAPSPTGRPRCPVWPPERGGTCLGVLSAGTHSTTGFTPPFTYTVPAGGWSNFEDRDGFFLLVPHGFTLAGVDAGGSDYIGIYTSVAAANTSCADSEQPGVAHTAAALAAEFANRPGLTTTTPTPVSVGGLQGLVLDIRLAEGWTQTCFYSGGNPVVPLIRGVGNTSGLDTPIGPGFMMRLYLADHSGTTLAIELGDNSGGTHLDAYSAIVDQLHFGS